MAAWAQSKIAGLELELLQKTTDLGLKTNELGAKTIELNEKTSELNERTAELGQKTVELGVLNDKITDLQTKLDTSIAHGIESANRISDLESKVTTKQSELVQVHGQLEQLQTSELGPAAATILEAQVTLKQNELALVSTTEESARFNSLSKALADQHYQLGKLYLKANDILNAEIYTEKAHTKRLELLPRESSRTRRAQQQLCKILRKTANETKIRRAIALYREYWERQTQDEFVLECGHELGCLYQEQGRNGEALPLFRAVWEKRRSHADPAVRAFAMSTMEHLLVTENSTGKRRVLEWLWANSSHELAGSPMMKHADALALIYWKKKYWAGAEPVLAALWAARVGDVQIPRNMSDSLKKVRLGVWFVTGYRYGVTLTKVGGSAQTPINVRDELYPRAKSIFRHLWTERSKLPQSVEADVTVYKLADYYAGMLLYFADPVRAETVGRTAWQIATPGNSAPALDESILYVGERYAKALNVIGNGKSEAAKDVYKVLFDAWKSLSRNHPQNRDLALSAIDCGQSLLAVLRARERAPTRCRELNVELQALERLWQPGPAPRQRLAIEWAP